MKQEGVHKADLVCQNVKGAYGERNSRVVKVSVQETEVIFSVSL